MFNEVLFYKKRIILKCLSISQPFADLIISGKKSIELRSWNTNFRGEFLIHSPLKVRKEDCKRLKIKTKLPTGMIVGRATLYDVKMYYSQKELTADKKFHYAIAKFPDKKFGFMLKNPKPFRIPIPWKGKLGFFDVEIPKNIVKRKDIISEIIDEEFRYQWIGHH